MEGCEHPSYLFADILVVIIRRLGDEGKTTDGAGVVERGEKDTWSEINCVAPIQCLFSVDSLNVVFATLWFYSISCYKLVCSWKFLVSNLTIVFIQRAKQLHVKRADLNKPPHIGNARSEVDNHCCRKLDSYAILIVYVLFYLKTAMCYHGRLARWSKWRACDVGDAKEGLENELWRRWSNGRVREWAMM